MPAYELVTRAHDPGDTAQRTFYWEASGQSTSFTSTFGPSLGHFGAVTDPNRDLVRIAVAARAVDASVSRGKRWDTRNLDVTIPVAKVRTWRGLRGDLEQMLGFLTGDAWRIAFVKGQFPDEQVALDAEPAARVALLSGGADSASGALLAALSANEGEKLVLVSHFGSHHLAPIQRGLVRTIREHAPRVFVDHQQLNHIRGRRAPDGRPYGRESSSRARSFLFISLGLAVASLDAAPLQVAENGFASINPPLGHNRRGSLSTRTTHPRFFDQLRDIAGAAGAHADLYNPFELQTKGQMLSAVSEAIGSEEASAFLSSTNSCAHSGQRSYGIYPTIHCGVCFGCVLRRASFKAAGIEDKSSYLNAGKDPRIQAWMSRNSALPAIRGFVQDPPGVTELAAMRLPTRYSLAEVGALCDAAISELRDYVL